MDIHRYMSDIGKKGGSVKSAAKHRAAKLNGKKGGRPKSKKDNDKAIVEKTVA
jgi:hypothetical protein